MTGLPTIFWKLISLLWFYFCIIEGHAKKKLIVKKKISTNILTEKGLFCLILYEPILMEVGMIKYSNLSSKIHSPLFLCFIFLNYVVASMNEEITYSSDIDGKKTSFKYSSNWGPWLIIWNFNYLPCHAKKQHWIFHCPVLFYIILMTCPVSVPENYACLFQVLNIMRVRYLPYQKKVSQIPWHIISPDTFTLIHVTHQTRVHLKALKWWDKL